MIRTVTTRPGLALALAVGVVAGGSVSCVEPEADDVDVVGQHEEQLMPTKCYEFTRGVNDATMWNIDGVDKQIDKWIICYTPKKGYVTYGDDQKCDTLEVTISIRGFVKTGEKNGKPVYTVYFTNHPGTTITMPMCKDEPSWKTIVAILEALNKVGIKWESMKLGFPDDPKRVEWKPGDPGADDFMKELIKIILKNVRVGKPSTTYERKPKTKEVPMKMSFNDFTGLDTWPVGVTEIEVTGDDVWVCADPVPTGDVLFAATTECAPPIDAEVAIHELGGDVMTSLDAAYFHVGELGLDVFGEVEEACGDGRLHELYELLSFIDPNEFTDDDNLDHPELDDDVVVADQEGL